MKRSAMASPDQHRGWPIRPLILLLALGMSGAFPAESVAADGATANPWSGSPGEPLAIPWGSGLTPELEDQLALAFSAFQRGRYQQAARAYLALNEAIDAADIPKERRLALKAMTQMQLVVIYDTMGLRDQARRSLQQARTFAAGANDPRLPPLIETLVKAFGRGQGAASQLPSPDTPGTPGIEDLLAVLAEGAAPQLLSAVEQMHQAQRVMSTSDYRQALSLLRAALPVLRRNGQQDLVLQNLGLQAAALQAQGQYEAALPIALEAVDLLEGMLAEMETPLAQGSFAGSDHASLYRLAISLLFLTERYATAFDYVERARARELLLRMGNRAYRSRPGETIPNADRLKRLHGEIVSRQRRLSAWPTQVRGARPVKNDPALDELQRELKQLRADYQALLVETRLKHPQWVARIAVDTLDLKTLKQDYLPADVTLVSFFTVASRVVVFVIQHEGNQVAELATGVVGNPDQGVTALKQTVRRYTEAIARASAYNGFTTEADRLGSKLYQALLEPVAGYIRHNKIIIVPHGFLHEIPFAALSDGKGKYLVERYAITYLPSANALRFLSAKGGEFAGKALVLGDPVPGSSSMQLSRLNHARAEAEAVAALFDTNPLLGGQATESQVRRQAKHSDLLHLAAHAIYDRENPRLSYIALAEDAANDGRLEIGEVLDAVDLGGVNLVVLSACDTGIGTPSGADDITSLERAFIYAGARSVISTMWPVDDAATARLMRHVYCRIMAGDAPAEALQRAQIAMLKDDSFAAPRLWAGFRLTGDHAGPWYDRTGEPADSCRALLETDH